MKKHFYIFIAFCCLATNGFAEEKWDRILGVDTLGHPIPRHEIRVGWGDQLFESLMWHNPRSIITTLPPSYQQTYHENYRHNQHIWLEYQYRCCYWFSVGAMIDVSEVGWDDVTRDGTGVELSRSKNHYFYNAVIMPTVRFTYFHHPNVNFYSGLGLGIDVNGGSEFNAKGENTDIGVAFNITVFGISVNYKRWFCTLDFGGMYALKDKNTIFMASSRMINVGTGIRF